MRIARTEALRAANAGAYEGYRQSNVCRGIQWLCGSDPCEFCDTLCGEIYKFDQEVLPLGGELTGSEGGTMKNGYGPVLYPPIHPNCVCDCSPVV